MSTGVTGDMCEMCVEDGEQRLCLMKIFHYCVPQYVPSPHQAGEFGDVSFATRLGGRDTYFKGLLKGYQRGEVWPRKPLGRDIISQIVTQGAIDRRDSALAVITAARLNANLETIIEWLVRQYQGKVAIVKDEQLMRILKRYKEQGEQG